MEFASSSSSSKSKAKRLYHVFINFRGGDTRGKFVSHLHYALSKAGVSTFLDEENLLKGKTLKDELMHAIEGSQIAIVVFSKSYTESSWCLEELEKILECHKLYDQIVVPIFYNIDPSVVRHQKGAFGKALKAAVAKKYSEELVEQILWRWGNALKRTADFSGFDASNRWNEAKLVKEIVDKVLQYLVFEELYITDFPVGLESRVQKVIGLIENQLNKVCMIGIWGMGGLGKTSTAKGIYNKLNRKFIDKSFIEDIREICQMNGRGHILLQKQILSDVLKTQVEILSVGMGTTTIKERLSGKKMLIVLDDVNELGQVESLCGNREWFGEGTIIIITTRDVHILNQVKVDFVYKVEEMDENESLELLSWHAFREPKPREDFVELARSVVSYCGGLPLALRVIGAYLTERTKELWKSVLAKLEKIPNDQVQKKLRISFDGLSDPMEKDIFLDVCCFFIGKDRSYVTQILNGCGLHANIGITVLLERSLIKVVKKNKLGMHPLLRDMGREIICESSRNEPGKRSRLWFPKDVLNVLKNNTGTEATVGLTLKLRCSSRDCFNAYAFDEMKSLRLLQLDYVQLTGGYGYLSKQLRWVSWQGFPSKYIPNNFNLDGVIAMDMKHSNLRLVWKKPQILQFLTILNLSHSKYLLETPDFSGLQSLQKLIVKDCSNLRKVHESIGDLHNLLLINMKDCTSLSNLPRELYKLKSVETLNISGCSKIDKLEEDIVQMESLTTLIAENTAVKQVPFSIVNLKSIGYISLCGYEGPSRNYFQSIIWSWMSPTMDPLSCIHSFSSTSSASLVSINMQNNDLSILAPMLSKLSNLRSIVVQCDTEFELSKQLGTILDDAYGVDFTKLEITSNTSQISKHYLKSYLIGIGCYQEVFNILSNSISEGLANSESCNVSLPGDKHPYWLAHMGEGHSVYFTVPDDCCIKGMVLCVVYLSDPEKTATECLVSVLIVNYTKCSIQICKRDTVISFNDVDWQGIISHLEPGDKVEIFVIFGHKLVVKKTAMYLMCDESIERKMVPSLKLKKNAIVRFIKKIVTSKTQ